MWKVDRPQGPVFCKTAKFHVMSVRHRYLTAFTENDCPPKTLSVLRGPRKSLPCPQPSCNAFPLGLPQSQLMWCKMQLLYCWQIPRSKSILPLSWPLYTGSPSALGFNLKSSWLLLDGQAPTHISALAQPHSAHRSLRSADKDLLSLPRPPSNKEMTELLQ